jgi:hypothetical protein
MRDYHVERTFSNDLCSPEFPTYDHFAFGMTIEVETLYCPSMIRRTAFIAAIIQPRMWTMNRFVNSVGEGLVDRAVVRAINESQRTDPCTKIDVDQIGDHEAQ